MAASFGDVHVAAKMRDLIVKIAEDAVTRLRPDLMIGQVYRFNYNDYTADIQLPGHSPDELITVHFSGNMVPSLSVENGDDTPDVVRLMGTPGSYFVIDFVRGVPKNLNYEWSISQVGMVSGSGVKYVSPPLRWLLCDGSFVSQTDYATLFSLVSHQYNNGIDPGNGTFKLPDLTSPDWQEDAASKFTIESGWTLNSMVAQVSGNMMQFYGTTTRTGATIATGTYGNVANQLIGTFAPGYRPKLSSPLTSASTGRAATYAAFANGEIQLAATTPGTDIIAGDIIGFGGNYMVAGQTHAPKALIRY